jgi:glyoxylase-like metal-dependent hydrolase (beta-lactamase superfamily II)
VWILSSEGQTAVVLGDVIHLGAVQLPLPATPMIYDVDPVLAGETRRTMLALAAREGVVVAGAHLPGPGIGRIVADGGGYRFVPVA